MIPMGISRFQSVERRVRVDGKEGDRKNGEEGVPEDEEDAGPSAAAVDQPQHGPGRLALDGANEDRLCVIFEGRALIAEYQLAEPKAGDGAKMKWSLPERQFCFFGDASFDLFGSLRRSQGNFLPEIVIANFHGP